MNTRSIFIIVWVSLAPGVVGGLDYVTLQRDGRPLHLEGEVTVEAADGGLLFRDRADVLWAVPSEELVRRSRDDEPYVPLSREELAAKLLGEFPGFRIHHTANYLIVHNTSPAYAQWCGALYERLFRGFCNFWQRRGFELRDPLTPLVAVVFDSPEAYQRYAKAELGEAVGNAVGYYSLLTNRVTMYDLTGTQAAPGPARRATTSAQINRVLMQPAAEFMVATIIHEATHQLAYNCGFHERFADIPLWVAEGLAMYFETPDLNSTHGWRNIGGVNTQRAERFRQFLPRRPADSLATMIASDDRFRDPGTALDAYAEAWAFTYFLLRRHPKQFVRYLQLMAKKPPLIYDTPEERLTTFEDVFGENLQTLNAQFLNQMSSLR